MLIVILFICITNPFVHMGCCTGAAPLFELSKNIVHGWNCCLLWGCLHADCRLKWAM